MFPFRAGKKGFLFSLQWKRSGTWFPFLGPSAAVGLIHPGTRSGAAESRRGDVWARSPRIEVKPREARYGSERAKRAMTALF